MIAYESARAVLHCGDARTVLPDLDSEGMDMVATDPPYGQDWRSNTRGTRFSKIEGDTPAAADALWSAVTPEIVRVTRRTRHLYTFGLPLSHPLTVVKASLVWDKDRVGSGDLSCSWGPSHEPIFFHIRAADKTNADRGSGALAARLRRGSVVRVRRLSACQVKRHPTEKPVALMRQLIESSSQHGETVFDPFAGSGSTMVAAVISGRRAVGVEIDAAYCETIIKRLVAAEKLADQLESV